jgi:hypothetical protein
VYDGATVTTAGLDLEMPAGDYSSTLIHLVRDGV